VEEETSGEKTVGESSGLRSARELPRDDHFVYQILCICVSTFPTTYTCMNVLTIFYHLQIWNFSQVANIIIM
jgi:hypothetical protein